jgi:hypothetical protein
MGSGGGCAADAGNGENSEPVATFVAPISGARWVSCFSSRHACQPTTARSTTFAVIETKASREDFTSEFYAAHSRRASPERCVFHQFEIASPPRFANFAT